ncbi:MAG: non-hydrolyzing UDP-N-acetylglucosamine 2-epimerase [bacterium]
MLKVLHIFGTRPEAIKMAPVIKEMEKYPEQIISRVCVTAQHRQMLDQVLTLFSINPDFDLNIMQDSQSSMQVAASVLSKLEPILKAEQPDWVLVQGDTTTVAAASLAAFYVRAKVGHVEGGLRSFDKYQPFPEEINRRVTSVLADLHFAPTQRAKMNLLQEGVPAEAVCVTGNPVIDALYWAMNQELTPEMLALLQQSGTPGGQRNNSFFPATNPHRLILVTAHRHENFGKPLEQICLALRDIANAYEGDVHIIYPVHLNPNVSETVYRILGNIKGVTLIKPLDYLPFVQLLKRATLVLTDSGGLQEEAPGLGKPVLVLREVTERPEAVEAGTVRIVGTNRQEIVEWTRRLLDDTDEYEKMARTTNPYGDGHAATRIVKALLG